jgi:integrase
MLYAYLTLPDGKVQMRTCKHLTPKMAAKLRAKWQTQIDEGTYFKPKPRTELVLFADICDKAEEYYKTYTRGWDAIGGRIARFKEWWPNRTAESISTEEIAEHLKANVAPDGLKWSKTTANEYRVSLLRIFALAIERKELTVNPAATVKRHKLENSRVRQLSFAEEDSLRAAIRKLYPHKECELDLLLHLGCRRSNLYGQHNRKRAPMSPLNWLDVNLDFRVVSFPRSKSGNGYEVPINETALAALKTLRERGDGTGVVIRKPSGLTLHSCRRWFENCLADAGIEDFRIHDLRHTFASRLRRAKTPLEDIRYLLGHSAKSITERYAHPDLDSLRADVAKLDRRTETVTPAILEFPAAVGA